MQNLIQSFYEARNAGELDRRFRIALFAGPLLFVATWVGQNIFALSFRILEYQQDLGLDYAMGVLWWMIIAVGILAVGGEARGMLIIGWAAKFLIVLVAMLFYEQHYPLDAQWYYGVKVTGEVPQWPELGDVRREFIPSFKELHEMEGVFLRKQVGLENTIRAMLLIGHVTGPYYHAMKVLCAFFGFMGSWWFYRGLIVAVGREYPAAFYLLVCFPSIIFWSSILGKDPLQFFFLGLYAYGTTIWFVQGRLHAFIPIGIGMLGSYVLRPWTVLLGLGVLGIATLVGRCRRWQRMCLWAVVLLAGTMGGAINPESLESLLHMESDKAVLFSLDPSIVFELLEERARGVAMDTQATIGGPGSGVDLTDPYQDISLAAGFFAGLYRPLPFDARNPFVLLAAMENTILLILSLRALIYIRLAYFRDPLFIWTGLYTCGWAMTYGFIVMANFGSGARYKLQMVPFFIMFLMLLNHKEGRAFLDARCCLTPK